MTTGSSESDDTKVSRILSVMRERGFSGIIIWRKGIETGGKGRI